MPKPKGFHKHNQKNMQNYYKTATSTKVNIQIASSRNKSLKCIIC